MLSVKSCVSLGSRQERGHTQVRMIQEGFPEGADGQGEGMYKRRRTELSKLEAWGERDDMVLGSWKPEGGHLKAATFRRPTGR